ncbi:hypothetical protein BD310DRAFT_258748 [Dichomitus squalens]|uniref:Uncharacterized protein n=1 Tax=Dichomitus squalens TaxID=114155 RepID=A0A4Q9PBM6_9APHY|nr:hypothetical protein BD310DRAFT_258748 [Dichomitus squalens]
MPDVRGIAMAIWSRSMIISRESASASQHSRHQMCFAMHTAPAVATISHMNEPPFITCEYLRSDLNARTGTGGRCPFLSGATVDNELVGEHGVDHHGRGQARRKAACLVVANRWSLSRITCM